MEGIGSFGNKRRKRREILGNLKKLVIGAGVGAAAATFIGGEKTEKYRELIEELRQTIDKKNREIKELRKKIESLNKENFPKVLKVIATAYTSGPESTGKKPGDLGYGITKSGWPADMGIVAVDPEVIPLGSILYIPEYGYAIALDTGSAIKGEKIDVYFHDVEKALKWGVKEVEIIILGKIDLPEYNK
jgi:3D (Asp-Asp-Asp) domain-containing protein